MGGPRVCCSIRSRNLKIFRRKTYMQCPALASITNRAPLRDNKEKTCKDVGAQITRANKEKNDVATKEYRKVYMRYKMMTNRHPEDSAAAQKFNELPE